MLDIGRERDVEVLRQVCYAYEKANGQLVDKIRHLSQKLAALEGVDLSQIDLGIPEVHVEETVPKAPEAQPRETPESRPGPARNGHGPRRQAQLPIEDCLHVYDPPPDCDVCGAPMSAMSDQTEDAEEITVVETTYKVTLHRRQKYRCRCNGKVTTAPGPPKLIPGGRYSVDFALHTAIAKYCDHLPLERQVRRMERYGLEVCSQTLWDQVSALAKHLEPTWKAIGERILLEPVLHVDETGWRMMGSPTKPNWTVWGLASPELAWYQLASARSTVVAKQILGRYRGTLVVDGFAVYPKLRDRNRGSPNIAHCWAHVDRKLKEAQDPPEAIEKIRGWISKLYEIEREVEGPFPGNEAAQEKRRALRGERSAELIRQIRDWAYEQRGLRRSRFGKAVTYLLKHWEGLTLFLQDPRVPLDNNHAERALRGIVVGRKNFYGTRSRRGAKVASILYTLIETAKLQGVEPNAYLRQATLAAIRRPGAVTLPA